MATGMSDPAVHHVITLGNMLFTVSISERDSKRRHAYFENPKTTKETLNDDERAILKALGMNEEMFKSNDPTNLETSLLPYMAKFFDQLPFCQSDTSLVLSNDCEVVHYVLWHVLFIDRQHVKARYDENRKIYNPLSDLSTAIDETFINTFRTRGSSTGQRSTNETSAPTPTQDDDLINELFTPSRRPNV
jgi:hypothetical protein